MRTEHPKHRWIINKICEEYGGRNIDHENRSGGMNYPDIITDDEIIEVEMLPSKNYRNLMRKLRNNIDDKKRRILIIALPDEVMNQFDDCILLNIKQNS